MAHWAWGDNESGQIVLSPIGDSRATIPKVKYHLAYY